MVRGNPAYAVSKKRFGQNFLINPRTADRIVRAIDVNEGEDILEIGPGRGILTERILGKGAHLTAVEIDRELIPDLTKQFGGEKLFKLIEGDIIDVDLSAFGGRRFKIIGNLPYNISGALFEWLIDHHEHIDLAIVTVQKEVASRVKAVPGSRDYGSLSVLVGMFYNVARLFDIAPGSFSPKPKVTSSVLRLTPDRRLIAGIDYESFRQFVYACFARKRKTLVNSLSSTMNLEKPYLEKTLVSLGKRTDIRAEHMSGQDFLILYGTISGNE